MRIDLNADLGEGFGAYHYGADEELLTLVTSANIACGWHGGDPSVIRRAVRTAKENGVVIGAHPGYPDRMGFGRREMKLSRQEVIDGMLYQLGALSGICRAEGAQISYVKPHGALYNAGNRDRALAEAIVEAVRLYDESITLLCPAGGALATAAAKAELKTAAEFFADRAYRDDGSLQPRGLPGAVIVDFDTVCRRVLQAVKEESVRTVEGSVIPIHADSICLHGDNPEAVLLAQQIRARLSDVGIVFRSFADDEDR